MIDGFVIWTMWIVSLMAHSVKVRKWEVARLSPIIKCNNILSNNVHHAFLERASINKAPSSDKPQPSKLMPCHYVGSPPFSQLNHNNYLTSQGLLVNKAKEHFFLVYLNSSMTSILKVGIKSEYTLSSPSNQLKSDCLCLTVPILIN